MSFTDHSLTSSETNHLPCNNICGITIKNQNPGTKLASQSDESSEIFSGNMQTSFDPRIQKLMGRSYTGHHTISTNNLVTGNVLLFYIIFNHNVKFTFTS